MQQQQVLQNKGWNQPACNRQHIPQQSFPEEPLLQPQSAWRAEIDRHVKYGYQSFQTRSTTEGEGMCSGIGPTSGNPMASRERGDVLKTSNTRHMQQANSETSLLSGLLLVIPSKAEQQMVLMS